MRLQPLVLLAVLSNTVAAGLIRYNDRLQPRYVNSTTPAASTTPPSNSPTAQHNDGSPTPSASKQVGSVPAFGDGPGAATTIPEITKTTPKANGGILTASSASRSQFEQSAATPSPTESKQVGSVPAFGSGPGAATQDSITASVGSTTSAASKSSSGSNPAAVANPGSTEPGVPTISLPKSFTGTATPVSTDSTSTVALSPSNAQQSLQPSPAESTSNSAPKPAAQAPTNATAQNGNIAMALGFNSIFASMNADSPCDAKNPNEAVVCINGEYAQCGSNGKYTLAGCPQGQQCFALPLPRGVQGVTVQCASMQAANQQLGQGSQSSPPVSPTPVASPQPKPSNLSPTPGAPNGPTTQSKSTGAQTTTVQSPTVLVTTQQTNKPSGSPAASPPQPSASPSASTTTTESTTTTAAAVSPSQPTVSPIVPSTTTTESTTTTAAAVSPLRPTASPIVPSTTTETTTTTSAVASPSKPSKSQDVPSTTTASTTTTSAVASPSKPSASPDTPTTETKGTTATPAVASKTDDPIIISIVDPRPTAPPNKIAPQAVTEPSKPSGSIPDITAAPLVGAGQVTVTDFVTVTKTVHDGN